MNTFSGPNGRKGPMHGYYSAVPEIAVIRYSMDYQDYFSEQAQAHELSLQPLAQVEYQIVLSQSSPLSNQPSISKQELNHLTELLHRDTFYPFNQPDKAHCRIYTVDRLAQIQLLQAVPNTFLWSEPLSKVMLDQFHLVQRPCTEGSTVYQNALVYKPQCTMSEVEKAFLRWITEKYNIL